MLHLTHDVRDTLQMTFVSPQELMFAAERGVPVIDVRPIEDYAEGHIKGSISVQFYRQIEGALQGWLRGSDFSDFGFQFGVPSCSSDFGFRFGVPIWGSGFGFVLCQPAVLQPTSRDQVRPAWPSLTT
jgi:rhodanese-related sulfurtransferase